MGVEGGGISECLAVVVIEKGLEAVVEICSGRGTGSGRRGTEGCV